MFRHRCKFAFEDQAFDCQSTGTIYDQLLKSCNCSPEERRNLSRFNLVFYILYLSDFSLSPVPVVRVSPFLTCIKLYRAVAKK